MSGGIDMNNRIQNIREVLKKRQDDLSLLDFQANIEPKTIVGNIFSKYAGPTAFIALIVGIRNAIIFAHVKSTSVSNAENNIPYSREQFFKIRIFRL